MVNKLVQVIILSLMVSVVTLVGGCGGDDNPTDSNGNNDPSGWALTKTDSLQFDGGGAADLLLHPTIFISVQVRLEAAMIPS